MTLATEERPSVWGEVIGTVQGRTTQILARQVETGRTASSYLFQGLRGSGKTTCARIMAKAVNCLSPKNGNPCGCCANCRAIEEGSATDIIEIDAARNNGVDAARELEEKAAFKPMMLKKKVFILDEVHMLTSQAFNALLKLLEEPPAWCMFILCTTDADKLPVTVRSRLQTFTFQAVSRNDISKLLIAMAAKYGGSLTEDAAEIIARHSEGSVRDAVRDLNTCFEGACEVTAEDAKELLGISGWDEIFGVLDAVRRADRLDILNRVGEYIDKGKRVRALFGDMMTALADHLVALCGAETEWSPSYRELQKSFGAGEDECLALYRYISEAFDKVRYQDDRNSVMVFLLGASKKSSEDFGTRIGRIEAEIAEIKKGDISVRTELPAVTEAKKEDACIKADAEPAGEKEEKPGPKSDAEMFDMFDDDMAFMSAENSGDDEPAEEKHDDEEVLPETNWDGLMAEAAFENAGDFEIPEGFISAGDVELPFAKKEEEKPAVKPEPVCEVKEPEAKVDKNLHAGKSFTDLSELVAAVRTSNYQKFREVLAAEGMLAAMIRNCTVSSKNDGSLVVVETPKDTSALTKQLIVNMLSKYEYVEVL